MATILDISGKPPNSRKTARHRLREQDLRDMVKIVLLLVLIVAGFFLFAPDRDAADEIRMAAAQKMQG